MKAERGYPPYTVTPKAEAAILRGHPWVYGEEVLDIQGETANGGLVDVLSRKGRYLGTGFLSQQSKIRVRLLSRNANAGPGTTARASSGRRTSVAAG